MKYAHVGAAACGLLLLGAVTAQDRPSATLDRLPVPVRLTAEVYRAHIEVPDSAPGTLMLDCNLLGSATTLRVQDGDPDAHVVLLVGAAPAAIHNWGLGTLLVSPSAEFVVGRIGPDGTFEQPIDLARPELAGHVVYVQALQMQFGERARLSEGLAMRFTPGNEQPPLGYEGPPMTAIPCKAVDETIPTLYNVLLEFEGGGYYQDVRVVGVHEVDDLHQAIMVELVAGPAAPGDWVQPYASCYAALREVVDLGPFPKPLVEVWVGRSSWPPTGDLVAAAAGSCVVYEKAAVVDLRY